MFKFEIPTAKSLPYWLTGIAFTAAAVAFAGWIGAEQRCAERESAIHAEARAQINAVLTECEADKRKAMEELKAFMKESGAKYEALLRQKSMKK